MSPPLLMDDVSVSTGSATPVPLAMDDVQVGAPTAVPLLADDVAIQQILPPALPLAMDDVSVTRVVTQSTQLQLDDVAIARLGFPPSLLLDDVVVGTLATAAPASLAMDNFYVTTQTPTPDLIYLEWSNDRGHHFGNPVAQPIGEGGQYLTNIQWQRLGLARDRVFRLSWSTPTATALLGAFIEVDASPKS